MKVLLGRARRVVIGVAIASVFAGGMVLPAAARPATEGAQTTRSADPLLSVELIVNIVWSELLRGLGLVVGLAGEVSGNAPPTTSAAPQNDEGPGMGPDG